MRVICVVLISSMFATAVLGQTPAPATPVAPGTSSSPAPAAANSGSGEADAGPWKVLFDGKAVSGLRGLQKPNFLQAGWKIQDNALVLPKTVDQSGKVTGGDLVTSEAYTDFDFNFQYKLTVSGDTGILYLVRAGLGQKPSGLEFQLIDDVHHPDGLKGGPIKWTGALYGLIAPPENRRLDDKGWNEGRLIVRGNHVEHWLNGQKVVEYDLGSPQLMAAIKTTKQRYPPGFGYKFKSPIVILDQGEEVAFRNLRIRALAPPAPVPGAPAPATPMRVGPTPFKSRIP
jgi:hypothetical protein